MIIMEQVGSEADNRENHQYFKFEWMMAYYARTCGNFVRAVESKQCLLNRNGPA